MNGGRRVDWIERGAALATALGGGMVVLLSYAVVTFVWFQALPRLPRGALALSQLTGLVPPALALIAFARMATLLAPRVERRPDAFTVVSVATWTFVAAGLAGLASACAWILAAPSLTDRLLERIAEVYGPLLDVRGPWDVLTILLVITILPAACEELAFRGFMQRVLRSRFSAPVAIGVTSVVFAAFHLDPLGFPTRVMIGIATGACYERTGSLKTSMVVHGAHNLLVALATPWTEEDPLGALTSRQAMGGLAVALPACALTCWPWIRALRRLPAPAP